jgi:NAD(P)-dependent dehydrogenase (short-subunit alcohol dehydrogenase family)
MKLLEGRVAIVTGVGPGIGATTAKLLAEQGAAVGLGARTESALESLAGEITESGGRATWIPTNIAEEGDCKALAAKTLEEFGRIDILVQNAFMHPKFAPIAESDPEDWRRAYKVNVLGTMQMVQAVLPHMTDGSSIVVTNSMSARNSEPSSGGYAAAKSALLSMVRTLAQEVGPRGIRVNSVLPGWVEGQSLDVYFQWMAQEKGTTPEAIHKEIASQTALGRIVTPQDVAGAILFLVSDLARGITGVQLDVNAGHWLP